MFSISLTPNDCRKQGYHLFSPLKSFVFREISLSAATQPVINRDGGRGGADFDSKCLDLSQFFQSHPLRTHGFKVVARYHRAASQSSATWVLFIGDMKMVLSFPSSRPPGCLQRVERFALKMEMGPLFDSPTKLHWSSASVAWCGQSSSLCKMVW